MSTGNTEHEQSRAPGPQGRNEALVSLIAELERAQNYSRRDLGGYAEKTYVRTNALTNALFYLVQMNCRLQREAAEVPKMCRNIREHLWDIPGASQRGIEDAEQKIIYEIGRRLQVQALAG
jgi:hypothetical protein